MLIGNVNALKILTSPDLGFLIRVLGVLIVVNCWIFLLLSSVILLNYVSIKPLSVLIIFQIWLLVNPNTDVHFVINNKAEVYFVDVGEGALVEPIQLVELLPVIVLKEVLLDVLVEVYLLHLFELKDGQFKDADGHVPFNFLLVREIAQVV